MELSEKEVHPFEIELFVIFIIIVLTKRVMPCAYTKSKSHPNFIFALEISLY